jgi:hypothetical protein
MLPGTGPNLRRAGINATGDWIAFLCEPADVPRRFEMDLFECKASGTSSVTKMSTNLAGCDCGLTVQTLVELCEIWIPASDSLRGTKLKGSQSPSKAQSELV